MSEFQSLAYKTLLESHTHLNNYIKISTVAVEYLYNSHSDNAKLSILINHLIQQSGEKWSPRLIRDPKIELIELKNDLTKSAILWVYSSFDVFFKQIEGMLSHKFFPSVDKQNDEVNEDSKENKIRELYRKLNWDLNEIEDLLYILKFYHSVRHSVAHNYGKPSRQLFELSQQSNFIDAIANWKTKHPQKKISPPPIIEDNVIELKPHHSIIYSETCIRIAKDINYKLLNTLGLKYFVQKTIKTHLTDSMKLSSPECKNLTRYLVYHLKNDYNITINPYDKIYDYYENETSIKEHKARYLTLKNFH